MAKGATGEPSAEPRRATRLFGQAAAEADFLRAWRAGRVHHAWLLAGPPGIGKATFAYRVARFVLAGGGDGDGLSVPPTHPVARKVAAGSHPDLVVLEGYAGTPIGAVRERIGVDEVRSLASSLRRTPAESAWRVGLIDPAEAMGREAANALLKVLEEPPPRTVLLLVSHAPGRLLPTIRSRCRRLALSPLAEAEVAALLARLRPEADPAARDRAAALAGGSVGRALALLEEDAAAWFPAAEDPIAQLASLDTAKAHALAETFGRPGAEDTLSLFFDLVRFGLVVRARRLARDGGRAEGPSLEACARLWENLGEVSSLTASLALDRKQAVLAALAALARGTPVALDLVRPRIDG
ncbi:MAG: DNA polymerase III subunit delta' [Elioraea sp.]|nr:DNA polymerase III subunit delta' [Elioraea sp.]MDW8444125.1 DNA polymerase III subunit delta' [Acetobacteraceae bacterium]